MGHQVSISNVGFAEGTHNETRPRIDALFCTDVLMLHSLVVQLENTWGTGHTEVGGYLSAGLLACALSRRQCKALLLVGLGAAALVGLSCHNCAIGIDNAACALLISNHPDPRGGAG